jgi:hypothetical protein
MAAREGVFMKKWIGAAAILSVAWPAFAADVATCTLSTDRKTVTITASNPYSQVMACEVNCHMEIPHGFATVLCAKPVPVGARNFVMCAEADKDGMLYTRVKDTEANCPDPAALAPAKKDEDDSDAEADEMMKKMLKQGQEFLDRQKRK